MKEYRARFEAQANRESQLQKRLELLTTEVEALTKEINRERQMRLKLETEYT